MDNEKKKAEFEEQAKKLISEDNCEELFRIALEITELCPQYADGYVYLGIAKGNLGDYESAINYCTKAINVNPTSELAYISRAVAQGNIGNLQSAINDYTEALKIKENKDYYVDRGVAKAELGDRKGAIEDFDNALKLDHNHIQAIHNKGVAQATESVEKQKEETIKRIDEEYKKQITDHKNQLAASQKKQEETIKKINEEHEQKLAASQKEHEEQFKNRENELLDAIHYKNEKEKYEKKFDAYSNKKFWAMLLLILIVLVVSATLVIYLLYLIFFNNDELKILLFFPTLAIASLFLFPFIWLIRNINHDRSRCWAMSEDMHTKWILTLSIRYPGISEETREKLLLQFLEHLNNSNTPNIILSKDVGSKSDFNSMVKNFINQKDKE